MSADKETVSIYRAQAKTYAEMGMAPEVDAALDRLLSEIPMGGHILDLGCGPGLQGAEMIRRGYTVSGIDPTPEFVDMACENGLEARIGTFDDLAETARYDGIWASFSLLHAPKADFPRHLVACHRALKPGGSVCLSLKEGTGAHRDRLGRFYSYYSAEEIKLALEGAGFSGIETLRGKIEGLAGGLEPFLITHAKA